MKNLLFIMALCTFVCSCANAFLEDDMVETSLSKETVLTENDAKQKFAEIFSKAIYENTELREFIKDKAIQQFDNDFDVFLSYFKR